MHKQNIYIYIYVWYRARAEGVLGAAAVTFDMLIPKITLFSQYMCALAHLREGIIFQQRPSLGKCSNECVCMYKSNVKNLHAHFGRHRARSAAAMHNIIQQRQPTHTPSS